MIDAANILQTISIGFLAWSAKTLWQVTITQAEHGQKLDGHRERLESHRERIERLEKAQ